MISEERKAHCRAVAEIIDRLITVQLCSAGGGSHYTRLPVTQELYQAARSIVKEPLTYRAAMGLMERVQPRDHVLICTGFIVAPWMRPEVDGPIGSASLARSLSICFNATPVIVTENENIEIFKPLFEVTGLQVASTEKASYIPRKVVFEPYPLNEVVARKKALEILDRYAPSALIAIEKPSWNDRKVYHNGHGMDVSAMVAKTDILIEEAKKRGVFTIGIGDGGNEIGMGLIKERVKEVIPTAARCVCPCQGGIAADTVTDALIVGAVANWGSYGLEACLACASDTPKVLHDGALERLILEASIRAGIVDPSTGLAEGQADGTTLEINVYLIEMLNRLLEFKNPDSWRNRTSRSWRADRERVLVQMDRFCKYLKEKDELVFKYLS